MADHPHPAGLQRRARLPGREQILDHREQLLLGRIPRLEQVVVERDLVDRGDRRLGVGVCGQQHALGVGDDLARLHAGTRCRACRACAGRRSASPPGRHACAARAEAPAPAAPDGARSTRKRSPKPRRRSRATAARTAGSSSTARIAGRRSGAVGSSLAGVAARSAWTGIRPDTRWSQRRAQSNGSGPRAHRLGVGPVTHRSSPAAGTIPPPAAQMQRQPRRRLPGYRIEEQRPVSAARRVPKSNIEFSEPAIESKEPGSVAGPVVLDELDDRGLVGQRVVDVAVLRPRRDHQQRQPRTVAAAAVLVRQAAWPVAAQPGAVEEVLRPGRRRDAARCSTGCARRCRRGRRTRPSRRRR